MKKLALVVIGALCLVLLAAGPAAAEPDGNYGYINYDYKNSNAHVSMWLHKWNGGPTNQYVDGNWKFVQNNQSNITDVYIDFIKLWRQKCDHQGNNCGGWDQVEDSIWVGTFHVGGDNVVGPFDTSDTAYCGVTLNFPVLKYHVQARYKFKDGNGWGDFKSENSNDFVVNSCG